ncbi:MAG TPA: hypothetical protein VI893_10870 [Thermoplasmata archaeon]|nr:hypothetical protein [Thermoplasmata archaeon]
MIVIEAQKIGLPATASGEEIAKRVYAMAAENEALKSKAAEWQKRTETTQAQLVELKSKVEESEKMKAEMVVDTDIAQKRITDRQRDVALKIFRLDESGATYREWIEAQADLNYLTTRDSLQIRGGETPDDPEKELAVKAATFMANDPKLTQAEAVARAHREDKTLFGRIREQRAKAGASSASKGGER